MATRPEETQQQLPRSRDASTYGRAALYVGAGIVASSTLGYAFGADVFNSIPKMLAGWGVGGVAWGVLYAISGAFPEQRLAEAEPRPPEQIEHRAVLREDEPTEHGLLGPGEPGLRRYEERRPDGSGHIRTVEILPPRQNGNP
ncbi:MAG: hypothetical protein HYW26_02820 [Candidatus Aenigmarchaeota archaeon]|nr:hypothetical protein [Candidatus Aenigmarchaeota archaeon]